jgi:DNA anti-recombination protein RmuC
VVAKVRERLAESKQAAQKFDAERFNLKKLSELEVRKQYWVKISNRFAASEYLYVSEDINRAWENIKENLKISGQESLGLHEWKQHKPWFDAECAEFLDKRKQAKIQRLQNPNQNNGDNLHNIRREAGRHFRNKKKEYLNAKINELETNSKNKNIRDLCRGINDFKRGYQPRTNVVKDDKGDLFADSHSILAR